MLFHYYRIPYTYESNNLLDYFSCSVLIIGIIQILRLQLLYA